MAAVTATGVRKLAPNEQPPSDAFTFDEIADDPSLVAAKKVVAYPRREVQFHKAEIYVGGQRVMKMPLFQVDPDEPAFTWIQAVRRVGALPAWYRRH